MPRSVVEILLPERVSLVWLPSVALRLSAAESEATSLRRHAFPALKYPSPPWEKEQNTALIFVRVGSYKDSASDKPQLSRLTSEPTRGSTKINVNKSSFESRRNSGSRPEVRFLATYLAVVQVFTCSGLPLPRVRIYGQGSHQSWMWVRPLDILLHLRFNLLTDGHCLQTFRHHFRFSSCIIFCIQRTAQLIFYPVRVALNISMPYRCIGLPDKASFPATLFHCRVHRTLKQITSFFLLFWCQEQQLDGRHRRRLICVFMSRCSG